MAADSLRHLTHRLISQPTAPGCSFASAACTSLNVALDYIACCARSAGTDPQVSGREFILGPRRDAYDNAAAWGARCSSPSPFASCSGRLFAAASRLSHAGSSQRSMTSLSKTGIPGPDPEIANSLSQYYGGHHIRRIKLAGTVLELDDVLHACRRSMKLMHVAAAALKLEQLYKEGSFMSPATHAFHFQRMAAELESVAVQSAPRLVAWHIASLLRGLTSCGHTFKQSSLMQLAARVVANNCQRLQVASDKEVTEIMSGFAAQVYTNEVMWHRLYASIIPRLAHFEANRIVVMLQHQPAGNSPAAFAFVAAATSHLASRLGDLQPRLVVDLAQVVAKMAKRGASGLDPGLVKKLQQVAPGILDELKPKQVALLVSATARMQRQWGLPKEMQEAVAKWVAVRGAQGGLELQHVAGIVQAMAASGHDDLVLYSSLAEHAQRRLQEGGPAQAWALRCLLMAFGLPQAKGAEGVEGLMRQANEMLEPSRGVVLFEAKQQVEVKAV